MGYTKGVGQCLDLYVTITGPSGAAGPDEGFPHSPISAISISRVVDDEMRTGTIFGGDDAMWASFARGIVGVCGEPYMGGAPKNPVKWVGWDFLYGTWPRLAFHATSHGVFLYNWLNPESKRYGDIPCIDIKRLFTQGGICDGMSEALALERWLREDFAEVSCVADDTRRAEFLASDKDGFNGRINKLHKAYATIVNDYRACGMR